MSPNPLAISLRAKKLGVLIYDARLTARRSILECAQAMGISEETFAAYESGALSPSLPEVETLAYFLNIPLDHFWSRVSLKERADEHKIQDLARLSQLRQRMIGASLRKARQEVNLSPKEVTERSGISEVDLRSFELGETPIPLPVLDLLISHLGSHVDFFVDRHGPVGNWISQEEASRKFRELTPELQNFVCQPVNKPYIELAMRLSELSAEKLRAVAESLLEITY